MLNCLNLSPEDMIISNTEENYFPGIFKKTIHAFDYVNKKYDYKHILRTNLSSFFIIDKLIELNNKIPTKNIYYGCGRKRMHCGAAIWFSRDVIEYIILNKEKGISIKCYDDWAIFKIIQQSKYYYKNLGIELKKTKTPRFDVVKKDILTYERTWEKFIKHINEGNHYHIRVVNGTSKSSIDERINYTKITKKLTEYFYSV